MSGKWKLLAGAALILPLVVAHQDFWQWNRADLVYGFLPHNLAWHMGLCLVTAVVWIIVTAICWPDLSAEVRAGKDKEAGEQETGP